MPNLTIACYIWKPMSEVGFMVLLDES